MENKFDDNALQRAMAMANTPAGKEFIQRMQNLDPNTLKTLMAQASAGDYSQLQSTLTKLMESNDNGKFPGGSEGQ